MTEIERNPFFVLGVEPSCSRMEMERQGQLLLSMLEVGFADAATYVTPLGTCERTPEAVREAMATLRDPDARLAAELWAHAPISTEDESDSNGQPSSVKGPAPWESAMKAMGWCAA